MKRFLGTLFIFILPLVLIMGTTTAYYYFCIHPQLTGDLGRLGGITFGTNYSDSLGRSRLSRNMVVEYALGDSCNADIVTIGDSFSQQKANGYQNFMAHELGMQVLNIRPLKEPLHAAVNLLNSGFFDARPPRMVIVQLVERLLPNWITTVDIHSSRPIEEFISLQNAPQSEQLTTASVARYTFNWLLLQIRPSHVQQAQLDRSLFSLCPRTLYFYDDDLLYPACMGGGEQMQLILEQVHALFESRKIQLVVVIAVDKYDLYQKYIVKNVFPKKILLDEMDSQCDTTLFVNTKHLLSPELEKGVRDLYHVNDSHWAQTAAQIVGEHLANMYRQNEPNDNLH